MCIEDRERWDKGENERERAQKRERQREVVILGEKKVGEGL